MAWKQLTPALAGMILIGAVLSGNGCSGSPAPSEGAAVDAADVVLESARSGLAAADGTVRLIDFWATWCAPCREEVPMLKELHKTYGPQGLTILAISDENEDLIREFVAEFDIPYTNLVDEGSVVSDEYGVVSLPTAFLVDADGNVVEEFRGIKPKSILEPKIREALGLAAAAS